MPALGLTSSVLQRESKDGIALLDGILLVGLAGESLSDGVKSSGGRELVCNAISVSNLVYSEIRRNLSAYRS